MPFIRRNKISNTGMKRYAETESSWRVPLSELKYWVVAPPFMTHFFKTILFQDGNKKTIWWRESKAFLGHPLRTYANFPEKLTFLTPRVHIMGFAYVLNRWPLLMSIVTRKPVILNQLLILIISEINSPLSPVNRFFT